MAIRAPDGANKLQENGTVSLRSRHGSNRTQKAPSAVAWHQFPQFDCLGWEIGIFTATQVVTIQASARKQIMYEQI